MQEMTAQEVRDFLSTGARTGKIASVRPNGRPHLTPIWYVLDGDDVIFTTWHDTVKAENLRADPHVSLCVDDEEPPFAFVIVEGVVEYEESPDLDTLLHWTTTIARRYMGNELAESYGKRNAVPGEWLIRLKPEKIIARKNIAE